MFFRSVLLALAATSAFAQQCGPSYGNCAAGKCCSQYGWCDTGAAYCDATTCQPSYSGSGSSCAALINSTPKQQCGTANGDHVCQSNECCSSAGWCDTDAAHCSSTCQKKFSGLKSPCNGVTTTKTTTSTKTTTKTASTSSFTGPYASKVPDIDVCGAGSGSQDVSCPGAGINGYFYRCCSSHGHCGPKNNIQDQSIYCGVQEAGCQSKYGSCNDTVPLPPNPTGTPGVAQNGDTCGPIVNKKCAAGLCCSGSNFCGTGTDFCGSANWCQPKWGVCSSS